MKKTFEKSTVKIVTLSETDVLRTSVTGVSDDSFNAPVIGFDKNGGTTTFKNGD